MGFVDAVKSVYSNYFNFQGRARRSEYWWFTLFYMLIYIPLYVLMVALPDAAAIFAVIMLVFILGSFLPYLAAMIRRLHDTGRSGWWYFISFIPLVGAIVLIVFLVGDSEAGENKYGPNPKEDLTKVFE